MASTRKPKTTTQQAAVMGAMSVAKDIAEGKLTYADLGAVAAVEARKVLGDVIGPGDVLWSLHGDVGRQWLALGAGRDGGITADELSEWVAVAREREAGAASSAD